MDWKGQVAMVINAAESLPRLAPGHGSRRAGRDVMACNAEGCVHFDKKKGRLAYDQEHYQNQIDAALDFYERTGFQFDPFALFRLGALVS